MTKKVFVTGGTGFLGRHLIERLVSEGNQVLALTRTKNSLINLPIHEVVGSFNDIQKWENELSECDVLIHCAARVEFWGAWQDFFKDNTLATLELLKSAEKHNVKRFIYISSESVLQDKKDLFDIDESYPYPKEPSSNYGKSKMLAEQGIISFNGNIQKIILRPTFIYGKGVNAIETLKEKVKTGTFSWIDKGDIWMEMVYVKNVVEAITKAFENGKNNGIYNITDHSKLKAIEFLSDLMATENVSISKKNTPSFIAKPAASIVEIIWKVFGNNSYPPLTRFDLSFIAMNRQYKTEKAINELNYKPIYSTVDALKEMGKNT
ncbi:NAD(P)-dependent oxidoreductase [Aquiflexum sp. TKW24L]|uniref:NAD-dependent epimerase/dehydratase family protein n=1 Tax=Aquiflexum sp. TKW24L TaxID=2942212 RepID=UPI0020BEAA99|nr:NAD(P)-dependent oxidoreductase [Aquiflexum sp. TKW24L]MCL6260914.1 NAD(P)-dependent oxidoreductase [Aquiflexum sp. TKW24L]